MSPDKPLHAMALALCALLLAAAALAQEPDDEAGEGPGAAELAAAVNCKQPASFAALFELSGNDATDGGDSDEALSEANEAAFLKCPYEFLLALKGQPRETVDGVVKYFGLRHPVPELGAQLKKWKNHPQVGPLVRSRFAAFL